MNDLLIDGMNGKGPPMDCTHCGRWIPGDMIASYDTSGCPLAAPCVKKPSGEAWPVLDEDDDDFETVPDRKPVSKEPKA